MPKKKQKFMTVPVPKPRSEAMTSEAMVMQLQALMLSDGWRIVRRVTDENIRLIEEQILEKRIGNTILTDEDVDRLRDKRGFLKDLAEFPERFIGRLQKKTVKPEEYDPYYHDAKELIKERRKKG
jgi:hypothetical protein